MRSKCSGEKYSCQSNKQSINHSVTPIPSRTGPNPFRQIPAGGSASILHHSTLDNSPPYITLECTVDASCHAVLCWRSKLQTQERDRVRLLVLLAIDAYSAGHRRETFSTRLACGGRSPTKRTPVNSSAQTISTPPVQKCESSESIQFGAGLGSNYN